MKKILSWISMREVAATFISRRVKGGRGNFVSRAMPYYACKNFFAWGNQVI